MELVVGFLLGLVLGSFGLVLASRSLKNQSFGGRSKCGYCKHTLSVLDLFPVFSYLILRGRCRYCKKKIGLEYPIVEIITGLLIGYLFYDSFKIVEFSKISLLTLTDPQFLFFLSELIFKTFFITVLVVLFITDFKEMFIPDRIVIPAIKISLVYLVGLAILKVGYLYYFLSQTRIGQLLLPPHSDYFLRHAILTFQPYLLSMLMALLIGGFFYGLIVITKGKGMGGGDVKLGALMGLALGFPNSLLALVLAFLTGTLVSIILIIFGKKHFGSHIAFGPFLVLGSLIALFWGSPIVDWYLSFSI